MSAPEITRGARHSRRSRRLNYLIAGITWTCGAAALLFAIWGWLTGHANAVSVLNTTFVVIATALGGLLALSGDGDVVLFTGADEGQRDAIFRAAAHAFGVAIWGMFALWMAYQFQPAWRAAAYLHVGVLLALTSAVYLAGYIWRRRL